MHRSLPVCLVTRVPVDPREQNMYQHRGYMVMIRFVSTKVWDVTSRCNGSVARLSGEAKYAQFWQIVVGLVMIMMMTEHYK